MPAQVTTRQFESLPNIVWLSADPTWQRLIDSDLGLEIKKQFSLRFLSPLALDDESWDERAFDGSYKVVLAFSAQELNEYRSILENIYPKLQHAAVLIIIPWAQALVGEGVSQDWQYFYDFAQAELEKLMGLLPNAKVVLVEELLLKQRVWQFPSTLMMSLMGLSQQTHQAVTNLVAPLDIESFIYWLPNLLGQPHKPQTVVVRARKEKNQTEQAKLVQLYEKMYTTRVKSGGLLVSAAARPSWITKQQVLDTISFNILITDICQQLPPPNKPTPHPSWLTTPLPPLELNQQLPTTAKPQLSPAEKESETQKTESPQAPPLASRPKKVKKEEISQDITKLFRTERVKEKTQGLEDLAEQELIFRHKRRRRQRLFYGGVIFIGVGLGLLTLICGFWLSQHQLEKNLQTTLAQLANNQPIEEQTWQKLTNQANRLGWQAESYTAIVESETFSHALQLQQVVATLNEARQTASQSSQAAQNLALSMLNNDDASVEQSAQNALIKTQEAYQSLARLQAQAENSPLIVDSPEFGEKLIANFTIEQQKLITWQRVLPIIQSISTKPMPQRYLLVFQNEQEIRPTGGFIQAIAILTFERGRLIDFSTYSSYQIDDLLPGIVNPPDEVGRYLNEKNWYFRDANWDPHLPSAASRLIWFVDKALNTELDGAITINATGLANLLDALGSLEMPQYNEIVTADNLNERLEFHSSVQLDNKGSGSDYSALLLQKLLISLQNIETSNLSLLANELLKNVQESEMQFYATDTAIQSTISTLSWSGELMSPSCPSQFTADDCQIDTLAQVEANIGVNKANAYLRRQIDHKIELTGEKALHTRTITLENTARTASWPKGPYQAYIRFYLPNNAVFKEVRWDEQLLSGDQIRLYREHERLILGVPISLSVSQTKKLNISFETPHQIQAQSAYLLFDQKQAGRGQTDYKLTLSHPTHLTARLIAPSAESFNSELIFQPSTSRHIFAGVQF